MAGREGLEGFPRFGMPSQAGLKVGREGKLARFAVEMHLDADEITRIGARRLAQRRIDLHAEAAASGGDERGAGELAVHDSDYRDVLRLRALTAGIRAPHLLLQLSRDIIRHVNVPHHPDAINRRLKTVRFVRHAQRGLSYKVGQQDMPIDHGQ